jgi:phospholipase/lecithinase/hemolysin
MIDPNRYYEHNVLQWNSDLRMAVDDFQSRHPDITVNIYDAYGLFNKVLDDPVKYGFKNSTCIGSQNGCIWFDNFHPGSAFYKVLAKDIAEIL